MAAGCFPGGDRLAASGDFAEPFPGGPGLGIPGAVGVSVTLEEDSGDVSVQAVLEGTPASEAGIKTGDRIVKVDGISLRGATLEEALGRLRGYAGVAARVTIARHGSAKPIEVSIVRTDLGSVQAASQP